MKTNFAIEYLGEIRTFSDSNAFRLRLFELLRVDPACITKIQVGDRIAKLSWGGLCELEDAASLREFHTPRYQPDSEESL